jgi:hypothetical protein
MIGSVNINEVGLQGLHRPSPAASTASVIHVMDTDNYHDDLGPWSDGDWADDLSAPAEGVIGVRTCMEPEQSDVPSMHGPHSHGGHDGGAPAADTSKVDSPWPWLREKGQDRTEVQEKIFAIWRAYEKHRADSCQTGSFVVEGVDLPVYTRPPGYDSEQVRKLADCASKYDPRTFNMAGNTAHAVPPAVCVVDSDCGEQSMRGHGDRVSFGGPKGRVMYPVEALYLARVGADRIPPGSGVKPWRFDLVAGKEAPPGQWYVCLFVPYTKPVQAHGKRRRVDEHVQGDASSSPGDQPTSVGGEGASGATVEAGISMLVESLFEKAKSEGFLTRGGEQENEFRRMVTQNLQTLTQQFQGRDIMSVRWPDYVFEDTYVRLTFAEVCQHFEERKHLPHLRPAKEVEDTGVDLISDHVKLVESVENLYLYLQDFMQKSQEEKNKREEEIVQLRTLTHQTLDSHMPRDIAGARMKLRKKLWEALKFDDDAALVGALDEGARTFDVTSSELMVLLDRWLWRGSAGKGKDGKAVGLIAAAATNTKGVPAEGALRCVTALVRRFSNDRNQSANLPAVTKRAQNMGRTRVAALLRDAFATPLQAPPPEPGVKNSGCASSTVSQIATSADEVPEASLCTVKGGDSEEEGGGGGGTGKCDLNKVGEGSVGMEGNGRLRTGMLVSSMLYKKEAELFCQFALHLHQQAHYNTAGFNPINGAWCDRLKKTLQHTLQHQEITVSVKGSVEKGTNTSDSDIDVFIDTHGLRVSRQEKERIVEVLRTADGFHQSHVKLKKLAIGCVVFNMEVDLVFSDTEEYGQLPGNFVQRFESNKAVQNAARMLKISFQRSSATSLPPEKVPSFVLETLVLEAQEYRAKMMLCDVLSDGSMELFCDALQFLVDSPEILNSAQAKLFALASGEPCGLQGSKLSQGKLHSAQRHALDLLHLLCASRFYSLGQKGFTNLFDIERWIRKYSGAELNTPLGPVPSWIMGRINNEEEARNPFVISGETHPGNFQNDRTLKECKELVDGNHASTVFLDGPMAQYTLMGASTSSGASHDDLRVGARVRLHSLQAAAQHNGADGELLRYSPSTGRWDVKLSNGRELAVQPGNLTVVSTTSGGAGGGTNSAGKSRTQWLSRTTMMEQMQELLEYTQRGSVVAQHMLLTRQQWMTAEMALLSEDYEKAVRFLALSARSSHADGDHFSGWWEFEDAGLSRKYHKAVDFISRSNRSSEDPQLLNAKLVRAWMCFQECKWSSAEELLTECITQSAEGSVDPAFYRMRLVVRGCVKDWRGNLEDAQRCIELIPEDPMPYFWKGVAMRNLCESMQAKDAGEKDAGMIELRNAFRHFIKIAPQEGRKVCQVGALLNRALRRAHPGCQCSSELF